MRPTRRFLSTAVLAAAVPTAGCDPCAYVVAQRVPAPRGAREAFVVGRDCGATTSTETNVSVVPPGDSAAAFDIGNVVRVLPNRVPAAERRDTTEERYDTVPAKPNRWVIPWVRLRWATQDTLVVTYDHRTGLLARQHRVGDVVVRYESR